MGKTMFPINIYDIVDCPRSTDIIFRKGKSYLNNPGNVYFRSLIEATNREHSLLPKRTEKVAMTWRIVQLIEDQNDGRFLDWDKTHNIWYIQKDRNNIREKVAHTYKEYNRSNYIAKEKKKQQQRMIQLPCQNNNVNKRRKVITTTTTTMSSKKSCFGIRCVGGGSEYASFESLFSDL